MYTHTDTCTLPIVICIFVSHWKINSVFPNSGFVLLLSKFVCVNFPAMRIFIFWTHLLTWTFFLPLCIIFPLFTALLPCRWLPHPNLTNLYILDFMLTMPASPSSKSKSTIPCYTQPPFCWPYTGSWNSHHYHHHTLLILVKLIP